MTLAGRHAIGWALPLVLLAAVIGCDRAGEASNGRVSPHPRLDTPRSIETADALPPTGHDTPKDVASRLDGLRAQGRFEEFIDGTLNAAAEEPDNVALQLLHCEALLASGRASECEGSAIRAATLASATDRLDLAAQALKLWATARFRQCKSLDDSLFVEQLSKLTPTDAGLQTFVFWRDALGERAPYRIDSESGPAEMLMADTVAGSVPFELAAIQARANGAPMTLVFIDTGSQHTLMTAAAAQAAGVSVGSAGTQLIGFKGLTAAPGLIETLELGDLVLHDVPVLVGDSAPLVALGAQMSLGTELMQHVRFRINYPARRVTAEPADYRSPGPAPPTLWNIPVWTFSQICLARGQLPTGSMARVLVDTGDRAGTFVSYRWARRNVSKLQGSGTALVFRFKKRNISLEMLELGSLSLPTWPIEDTIPNELDRLNRVDVILGHDLLWPYQLTIDLPARLLQLHSGTSPPATDAPNKGGKKP